MLYSASGMRWIHKGLTFEIELQQLGALVLASTPSEREGPFVRRRPFSALGRSEDEAFELLKSQIELEYRKLPELG